MTDTYTRRALRRLLRVDPPPAERSALEIAAEVERHYRWNFTFNLLDGAAFWLGLSFISTTTILPLYVSKLTPSPLAIGLIAIIANSGWFMPQLFTANSVQRLPRRKPIVVNLGFFIERLPLFLLPLSALLALQAPGLALLLFFLGYAGHVIGAGVVATAWQDMIARIFPVDRRGSFFGFTNFIGNGAGALGATFSAWLLAALVFPVNFVATFALAALFITLSWAALAQTREPEQRASAPRQSSRQFWAGLPRILAGDHNFRRYISARLLMVLGGMGAGFLTVSAVNRWQVSDGVVGLYTLAVLVGQTLGSASAGLLADKRGHKLPMELGSLALIMAYLLAWLAPGPGWTYGVFLLLGVGAGVAAVSGMMIVLEFSSAEQRPTYVGLSNTAIGLLGMISPLIGAWLASRSYDWLFALSALFYLASLISLRFGVREPRWTAVERLDSTSAE